VGGEDIPDDLAVDGARNAVLELEVHLGDRVLSEDRGVRDVTCVHILSVHRFNVLSFTPLPFFSSSVLVAQNSRVGFSGRRTDGGGLNHVADGESLDGLVLGGASRAVGATDRLDVAPAVLVAAAVKRC
jgi:hypothetical protein